MIECSKRKKETVQSTVKRFHKIKTPVIWKNKKNIYANEKCISLLKQKDVVVFYLLFFYTIKQKILFTFQIEIRSASVLT